MRSEGTIRPTSVGLRRCFSIFFGCVLIGGFGNGAAAQDCMEEIGRMMSQLEASAEDELRDAPLFQDVSQALEYCLAGRGDLYESSISPVRKKLDTVEKPEADLVGAVTIADLSGQWCYMHESGERANYEFFENGTYRAGLAEMRWQWVIAGKSSEALPRATIVSADEEHIQLRIGSYAAELRIGFCSGSTP